MVTYWCSKQNSIFKLMKDPENFSTALIPCIKSECEKWNEKRPCVHLTKVENPRTLI